MLPKVATSLTRAVTSIQHQSYTIRNVLHQSSNSNNALAPWNSQGNSHHRNGTGTGSRYHTGYTVGFIHSSIFILASIQSYSREQVVPLPRQIPLFPLTMAHLSSLMTSRRILNVLFLKMLAQRASVAAVCLLLLVVVSSRLYSSMQGLVTPLLFSIQHQNPLFLSFPLLSPRMSKILLFKMFLLP